MVDNTFPALRLLPSQVTYVDGPHGQYMRFSRRPLTDALASAALDLISVAREGMEINGLTTSIKRSASSSAGNGKSIRRRQQ